MKRTFTHLFVAVLLMLSTTSWAQMSSFEVGEVYHFKNIGANLALTTNDAAKLKVSSTIDKTDIKQQWLVMQGNAGYVFRNLHNGKFLKGAGENAEWTLTTDCNETANQFTIGVTNTTYNYIKTNGIAEKGCAHYSEWWAVNTSRDIIGWNPDDVNSAWEITKIDYEAADIETLIEKLPVTETLLSEYKTALKAIFADDACTELNSTYTAMSIEDIKNDANYLKLSSVLKKTVIKVRGGNDSWAEDNADADKKASGLNWDAVYAKKFRVQMYEPYSIAGDITSFLQINAHANNDNPTGIYVNAPGNIYVMVEGEIKEGATLRIIESGSNRRIEDKKALSDGYALQQGLNVIPFSEAAGHLYICYNVDTYNPDGESSAEKFPYKISDYEPLKIHIEGGAINGFYNACGDFRATAETDNLWKKITGASVDCDADWEYMEQRANLSVLPILGHRQIILFQLDDTEDSDGKMCKGLRSLLPGSISVPETPYNRTKNWADYEMGLDPETAKINIWMEAWDRIMYSEFATLGLVSRSEMDKLNDFYPRWNSDGSRAEIYDYKNVGPDGMNYLQYCDNVDYSEYFNHHGVSLGTTSGYMSAGWNAGNYNINTFEALVDMPDVAGNLWGPAHEIGHQHQDIFNIRGGTEVTNNVFSNAAVWYMGIATSRYDSGSLNTTLSNYNSNLPFIDYNIWSMTQMFYKLWLYYHLAGNNTQFYPRFFEMLRHDPLNATASRVTGSESMLKIYEKLCDAAGEDLTDFFRAHGFFVLLDEYTKEDYGITVFTQTQDEVDAAIARVKSKYKKENLAILFINDGAKPTFRHDGETLREIFDGKASAELGSVNDFISGNTDITTPYTATLNSNDEIVMTGEGAVGFLIFDQNGKLISFADRTTFALSDEAKLALILGNVTIVAINAENEMTEAAVDFDGIKKTVLANMITKAQAIVDKVDETFTKVGCYKAAAVVDLVAALEVAKDVLENSTAYAGAYDMLYSEYKKVKENANSKILLDPSLSYIITNYAYDQTMFLNSSKVVRSESTSSVDKTAPTAHWQFKETANQGVYNIYNESGYYCPAISTSSSMTATETPNADALYTIMEMSDGVWAICLSPADGWRNFHSGSNNVVGWETSTPASQWYVTAVEPKASIADLADLEVLVGKTERLINEVAASFSATKSAALELQTTASTSNYFLWSNAPSSQEGDIANLVDGGTNNHFHTDYTSKYPSGSHFLAVDLGASNTIERFTFSHTTRPGGSADFPEGVDVFGSNDNVSYRYIGSAHKMPQAISTYWEFDGVMSTVPCRYLRFNYHANRGYWHMAEFDIFPISAVAATVKDIYSTGDNVINESTLTAAYDKMLSGRALINSASPSIDDIAAKKEALQIAYKALLDEYNAILRAKLATLNSLVGETNLLIADAGTVELSTPLSFELTKDNLYCNDPHKHSDVNHADNSIDSYFEKLTDGNPATFLHTDYSGSNPAGDLPHYLRVDLGENSSANAFTFTYTTRNNGNNCPSEIVVEGSADDDEGYSPICTLTGLPDGSSAVYNSSSKITRASAHRYIRFKVTRTETSTSPTFFVMAEFGISLFSNKFIVSDSYKEAVSDELFMSTYFTTESSSKMYTTGETSIADGSPLVTIAMLDARIAEQQAAKAALEKAMTEKARADLAELIQATQELCDEMSTPEGAVAEYYLSSSLTADNLAAVAAEIADADAVCKNLSAINADIKAAYTELEAEFNLLKNIKDVDVADRSSLQTLITEMEDLLELTTVDGAVETGNVALQVDSKTSPYYIWTYPRANDDNGNGALIDETDGVANIGTFTGTYWQSSSEAYSHYVEVDLGANIVLEDLAIDYTTRVSGAADSRPTGLKFYGSNDQKDYTELFSVTEGLPSTENTKWEMAAPYELARNYRYIRVAVASSRGGCFNMSDFNLYANSVGTVNEFYSTSDIFDCLPAVLRGYRDAKDAVAVYLTQDEYDTAKTALQAHIDALQAIVDGNVTDKKDLETLVGETEPLVTEAATISTIEEEITMQCTDANAPYYLYCNAEGKDNGGDDALGVSALVGENKDNMSHLHTAYKGNTDDNLDHYLRLDMGEEKALMSFKFSYTGRDNSNNNAPVEMVIEGSNDLENFEAITTLTELPTTAATVTYATDEALTNGKAYRYVRFMVTKTNNNAMYNDHPFFVLSKFSVTACKTIEVNANPNMPLNTLVTAHNEAVEAKAMVAETEHYVTQTAYNTAVAELKAAKDALEAAIALKNIPVKLTTDASNPALYKIYINRTYPKTVLGYAANTTNVGVENMASSTANAQSWYFMQGTDGCVLILPYTAGGKVLATNDFSEGNSKVVAKNKDSEGFSQNWEISKIDDKEWYNIKIKNTGGTYYYFSNHGGVGNKMGFYNSNASSDGGSMFRFVPDDVYSVLEDYHATLDREPGYYAPGYYTNAEAYNNAYDAVGGYIEKRNGTEAACIAAFNELIEQNNEKTTYETSHDLVDGGVYRIMNLITNTETQYKYHYIANNNAKVSFPTEPADDGSDLWVCIKDGDNEKYKFVSALGTLSLGWKKGDEEALAFTIAGGGNGGAVDGAVSMKNDSGTRMALTNEIQSNGLAFNQSTSSDTQSPNLSTDWYFQKVEVEDADVKFNVNISSRRFSSLYLPYDVEVPEGVSAFTAVNVDGNNVDLYRVADRYDDTAAGSIIPARTPVILYLEDEPFTAGVYTFTYAPGAEALSDAVAEKVDAAIIYGKILQTPILCVGNARYYKLGSKSGDEVSKMYWMYKEYSSDGTIASGNAGTDNGGYIRCSANKIYMKVDGGSAANSFSMRFAGGTSGIDEVTGENGEVKAIYDMQGRKLTEITMPGMYIVNGKKTIVK